MKSKLSTIIGNTTVVALALFSIVLIIKTAQYVDTLDRGWKDSTDSVMEKVNTAIKRDNIPLGPGKVVSVYGKYIRVEYPIVIPDQAKP